MDTFCLHLFPRVWSAKNPNIPNLSSISNDPITRGGIGVLGSLLYLCNQHIKMMPHFWGFNFQFQTFSPSSGVLPRNNHVGLHLHVFTWYIQSTSLPTSFHTENIHKTSSYSKNGCDVIICPYNCMHASISIVNLFPHVHNFPQTENSVYTTILFNLKYAVKSRLF